MDTTHKQEYRIRDLSTRSVTLFPTRAQIVREIKDVVLKPGANEITVVGLTPTADEDSIKVEGTGSAIISNITVQLLPNRDIFQDVYPDSDSDDAALDTSEDDEDDDDDDDEKKATKALESARDKLCRLGDNQKHAQEAVASAASRLKILDAYGNSLDKKRGVDIEANVETYRKEREKVFRDHMGGAVRDRELAKAIVEVQKDIAKLELAQFKEEAKAAKAKAKAQKDKDRLKEKELRRQAERRKEKTRIRKERENFWPRSCYTVCITLEAASFSPSSSRRSSIASASDLVKVDTVSSEDATVFTCNLSLSYVTSSAFWSPSYDLALSTTANTAMLCFDAQLTNMTSETWSNCKVILSTSQTSFSGIKNTIPALVPWRIKLAAKATGITHSDLADSREERAEKNVWFTNQIASQAQKPRAQLFGVAEEWGNGTLQQDRSLFQQQMQLQQTQHQQRLNVQQQQYQQQYQQQQQQQQVQQRGGALFGASSASAPPPPSGSALFRSNVKPAGGFSFDNFGGGGSELANDMSLEEDGATILEPTPKLSFQESAFEETGLTATYDVPSLKTLKPSSTASKQRVARISFTDVSFSHAVVAKYKPAAYLKAKLRNASKLTLLRGQTGVTLDGTFMGRSTLPRCSAGDSFTMSLGIDPAISVVYPKPDIKRSTTGVFTKGDNSVYTRTITLVNTRATAKKPVNITVLDQVPVSEDEKLRIELLYPRGLAVGSGGVATGIPGKLGNGEKDWGKATAALKKAGELSWDVLLNAGRSVKLTLEYEVALPTGEVVVQCP
ncbi:hypothetical protein B0T17DRAFT_534761 [Bombardia bombarda]|uniref:Mucoidy inhibitor-like protein n=1 Tax=Bombardia bombarda TaxID=252184 RepID=A0AA39WUA0_9PEZI|nr:hypothetical protein B0T17DRAFT_534761 [Bombardia bombarda]